MLASPSTKGTRRETQRSWPASSLEKDYHLGIEPCRARFFVLQAPLPRPEFRLCMLMAGQPCALQPHTAQSQTASRARPTLSCPDTGEDTLQASSAASCSLLCLQGLQCHLFFTNFFLEALGFKRLRPAPSVLSRTCRVAERLEMSFSAKGDTPAM